MAANNLTFEQASTFLTSLYEQATGKELGTSPVNTSDFVTVAQATLKTGYDNVMNSISQVLGRTIFSIRPYTAKFKGLTVDEQRYGAITRKINFIDNDIENDERYNLVDGQSVDMYKVKKPKVLQTNFYGGATYQQHITIFKDQLDTAFKSYEEFNRFISGAMQNVMDQLEQVHEAESRAALVNLITGKTVSDPNSVIDVLATYNQATGSSLTATTIFNPDNFVPFTKWLYSFVNTLMRMMAERSLRFHVNVTGKEVMRHTPADRMKAYMSANFLDNIESVALPSIFGADRMKMIDWEPVTYWQSISDYLGVNAKPTYLDAETGGLLTAKNAVAGSVVGVLFDEDACGITRINQWSQQSAFNAAGAYSNIFFHFTERYWVDFSENCVVLTLGAFE